MKNTLTVKVLRSADTDVPAQFQSFEVWCESRMCILDVLTYIQIEQDTTLAFSYSCRSGMCGTYSIRVNGKYCWTCRTLVESFRNQGLTLEPLPNYPVIRDLVVDTHIEIAYTHTGGMPVAIHTFCFASLRANTRLTPDDQVSFRSDPDWFTPYYRRQGIE